MDAYVEIVRADGTLERVRIEGDQTTLGRSPTAGIPIVNAMDLEGEHLLLAPRPDGCWVAVTEGAKTPVLRAGVPHSHGIVPWGTELSVGSLRIRVSDKAMPVARKDAKTGSPVVLVVALVAIPAVAWMLLSDGGDNLPSTPAAPAPSLFDEPRPCAERGTIAEVRARDAAEAASHKAERYPFSAQDGVQAVGFYATAERCFAAAGRTTDAERMRREREAVEARVTEDYRTHQLRLERALKNKRYRDAMIEARALRALTAHKTTGYTEWLVVLERRLRLFIDAEGRR